MMRFLVKKGSRNEFLVIMTLYLIIIRIFLINNNDYKKLSRNNDLDSHYYEIFSQNNDLG